MLMIINWNDACHQLRFVTKISDRGLLLNSPLWLNCRIPCHLFACHWIRIASIVLCFVLQRTPTNENNGGTEWRGIQQFPCWNSWLTVFCIHWQIPHRVTYTIVSLVAVFWMSRNAPPKEFSWGTVAWHPKNGCEGDYLYQDISLSLILNSEITYWHACLTTS